MIELTFACKLFVKRFWQEDSGIQTVEMILILIVIVGLISVFQASVSSWLNTAIEKTNNLINTIQ